MLNMQCEFEYAWNLNLNMHVIMQYPFECVARSVTGQKKKRNREKIPHVTGWVYDVVSVHAETEKDSVRKLYKVRKQYCIATL